MHLVEHLRAAALLLVRLLSLGLVASYLGLVLVRVLPDGPLRVALMPLSDALVGRFFAQRWGMFAPSPPTQSMTLFARCQGGGHLSPWADLTTPLTLATRADPLGMDLRLVTFVLGVARPGPPPPAPAVAPTVASARVAPPGEGAPAEQEPAEDRARREALWGRIGARACADLFPGKAFERVEFKLVETPLSLWPQGRAAAGTPVEHSLGIVALASRRHGPPLFPPAPALEEAP
jgi:hypothetical protein